MHNALSPETQQKIEGLCKEIAEAESASSDLREELYTHIEDKVLGYLNGEETLTEADAFLLAREHFGDRLRVRRQLSEVHPVGLESSLTRRLLAVALVTLALNSLLGSPLFLLMLRLNNWLELPALTPLYWAPALMVIGALLYFARRHAAGEAREIPQWYQRTSVATLLAAVAILLVGSLGLQTLLYANLYPDSLKPSALDTPFLRSAIWLHFGGALVAWFVWCDRRVKSIASMAVVSLAFLLYHHMHQVLAIPLRALQLGGSFSDAFTMLGSVAAQGLSMYLPSLLVAWVIYLLIPRSKSGERKPAQALPAG